MELSLTLLIKNLRGRHVEPMREFEKADLTPLSELISLRNKKALITGSGAGIGKAIAYRFAEAGADLELLDINEESLTIAKEELKQFKVNVNASRVDVSKKEEIDALWKSWKEKSQTYSSTTLEYIPPSLSWTSMKRF